MPTQDDIGLTARSERAFVIADADDVLTEARLLLRDVLPSPVHDDHAWAASLVRCHAHVARVSRALHRRGDLAASEVADVRVQVQERYLSVAGVLGLLDDGAERTGVMPLHTGRYVHVTLAEGSELLAVFWMPIVPVFRVSARSTAERALSGRG